MDKIICLGKNYAEHAKEMGEAVPEKPVIFIKPPSVLKSIEQNTRVVEALLPKDQGEVHHECELVIRLKRGGEKLTVKEAMDCVDAVTIGLDMTLRDVQFRLKKQGQPWTVSKVFRDSAIVGPWLTPKELPHWASERFQLAIDGKIRQDGSAELMLLKVPEAIQYISEKFPLCPGDLVFTGTPPGVGPVHMGTRAVITWGPMNYEVIWR